MCLFVLKYTFYSEHGIQMPDPAKEMSIVINSNGKSWP